MRALAAGGAQDSGSEHVEAGEKKVHEEEGGAAAGSGSGSGGEIWDNDPRYVFMT